MRTRLIKKQPNCKCKECGKSFYRTQSELRKGDGVNIFCSQECYKKYREKTYKHSKQTIEKIRRANKGKKHDYILPHAFKKGQSPWNKGKVCLQFRGKNHWNWKGGKSKRLRSRIEDVNWRIAVFERDGYRCQACGLVGVYLEAHHIKSYANYPDLRYEIDNGVTLCRECHLKTDNFGTKTRKGG